MSANNILERHVFHAGKPLITEGEKKPESYLIQNGEVLSFILNDDEEIELDHFGAGDVIGEANLISDYPHFINYKAVTDTTVIKVNRQDFEQKMKKCDPVVINIFKDLIKRIKTYDKKWVNIVTQSQQVDTKATQIVSHLLKDMSEERREKYQDILLPQFSMMIKGLEDLKRKEKQFKDAKKKGDKEKESKDTAMAEA